jgi:very-short-patch-repair endonuclease
MGYGRKMIYDYGDCLIVSFEQIKERKEKNLKNITKAQRAAYEKIMVLHPDAKLEWIFYPYIVDIYIPRLHVAIEIDGAIHKKKRRYDKTRDKRLRIKYKLKVYRFQNKEIFDGTFDMRIIDLLKIAQIGGSK